MLSVEEAEGAALRHAGGPPRRVLARLEEGRRAAVVVVLGVQVQEHGHLAQPPPAPEVAHKSAVLIEARADPRTVVVPTETLAAAVRVAPPPLVHADRGEAANAGHERRDAPPDRHPERVVGDPHALFVRPGGAAVHRLHRFGQVPHRLRQPSDLVTLVPRENVAQDERARDAGHERGHRQPQAAAVERDAAIRRPKQRRAAAVLVLEQHEICVARVLSRSAAVEERGAEAATKVLRPAPVPTFHITRGRRACGSRFDLVARSEPIDGESFRQDSIDARFVGHVCAKVGHQRRQLLWDKKKKDARRRLKRRALHVRADALVRQADARRIILSVDARFAARDGVAVDIAPDRSAAGQPHKLAKQVSLAAAKIAYDVGANDVGQINQALCLPHRSGHVRRVGLAGGVVTELTCPVTGSLLGDRAFGHERTVLHA
eukprot:5415870-Prymnesium_polylepis.1